MPKTSASRIDQILVIDDDVIMCELLSLLLGAEGHTVLTASSGEEALALLPTLLSAQLPTIFLADLKMPGMSPAALVLRLRVACPTAVLLAMSAGEPSTAEIADFDGFLHKPFDVADFYAAVELAHAHSVKKTAKKSASGARRSLLPDQDRVNEQGSAVAVLDEAIYSKLYSVMGTAQLPKLYALFLEDANTRVERMHAALADDDAGTFTREAHAIKGGCGMLGASELYSFASRLEAGGFACSPLLDDFRPAFERLRRILEIRMNQWSTSEQVDSNGPQTRR